MDSIIINIQKDVINPDKSISDILRQAYVVARKLKIKEFESWIYKELNGYIHDEIPDYRILHSIIKGWNPYRGWVNVIIEDYNEEQKLIVFEMRSSIPQLEDLLKRFENGIYIKLSDSFEELTGEYTHYIREINPSSIHFIIARVRNIILEWILKLEEDGIIGVDMNFTDEEKKIANDKNYTVNNFYGNISGSQIQQNSNNSSQKMINNQLDMNALKDIVSLLVKHKDELLCEGKITETEKFNDEIGILEKEIKKEKPSKNIISNSIASIRNILEGATGSIIASEILLHL